MDRASEVLLKAFGDKRPERSLPRGYAALAAVTVDRQGRPVELPGVRRPPEVWRPFVRASLAVAVVGGFGLGGALFAALAFGWPLGPWWPAAAQAHGHA